MVLLVSGLGKTRKRGYHVMHAGFFRKYTCRRNRSLIHIIYSLRDFVRQRSKFRSTSAVKLHWRDLLTCPFFIIFSNGYTHWRVPHCHLSLTHYLWPLDRTSLSCRGCSCLCRSARQNFTAILQFHQNMKSQKEFLECEESRLTFS